LFSVPGLVGGAVYMNAGRGRKYEQAISDYIISVDYFYQGKVLTLEKKDCDFNYRLSLFQQLEGAVIVGVLFEFERLEKKESEKRIMERMELCKKVQDMSYPNFGTVFSQANRYIMYIVRVLHIGYPDGMCFSSKKDNWMLHRKNGTFKQAIQLIECVKKVHKMLGRKCEVEVKIWK